MGESNILHQAKKGQGETNQRLDALLAEQQRTNQLLEQLLAVLTGAPAQQQTSVRTQPSWGRQV